MPVALLVASCAVGGPFPRIIEWHTEADGSVCKTVQLDVFMQRRECVPRQYVQQPPLQQYVPEEQYNRGTLTGVRTQDFGLPQSYQNPPPAQEHTDRNSQEQYLNDDDPAIDEATRQKLDELKSRLQQEGRRPMQENAEPGQVQPTQPQRKQQRVARQPPTVSPSPASPQQTQTYAPVVQQTVQSPPPVQSPPSVAPTAPPPQATATPGGRRAPNAAGGPVY